MGGGRLFKGEFRSKVDPRKRESPNDGKRKVNQRKGESGEKRSRPKK